MSKVKIKKVYVGQYEPMETVSRFLKDDVEYLSAEPPLGGDKFWYEVATYGTDVQHFWEHTADGNTTASMLPYLKSGQAKLAICYMREFPFEHDLWVQMQSRIGIDAVKKHGINPNQIFYFYGNPCDHLRNITDAGVSAVNIPYFELDFVHRVEQKEIDYVQAHQLTNPSRTFLDMNGKPHKFMRLRHVVHLWNRKLIDHGLINLYRTQEDLRLFNADKYYELVKDIINEHDWLRFWRWWPHSWENIDENTNNSLYGKHHSGYPYDVNLFKQTFMSLVSETHSGHSSCNNQFFLSEKLVKAIGNGHPFVVLSTPNYLEQLHDYGYQTFAPWFDESYDKELDPELRMVKAIDTMENICKTGVSIQALNIANNNQKVLFSRARTVRKAIKDIMLND
jgi:hypothetical protein